MRFRVLLIHVGNMNNKGAQALLKSDVSIIKEVLKDVDVMISTTDIEGVKRLNLCVTKILPSIVDIPHEKADLLAKRFGFSRASLNYKIFVIGSLMWMFFQALIAVISAIFEKIGLKGFYRTEVFNGIKNADIVVSCSDENFKETASLLRLNIYWILTWWSMLFSRTWDVLSVKFFNKLIIMFPNSIGPFRTRIGRFLAKLSLDKMSCILVREPISYEIVNSLGVKSPKILTLDSALLFRSDQKAEFSDFKHPSIGVSPGFYAFSLSKKEIERYVVEHAKALDNAIEKYGFYVYFLPHYVSGFEYDDLEVSKAILDNMRNKEKAVIYEAVSVEEFKCAVDQMDLAISSKMHPAVLAISGCVPTLCIAYDQKQTGFFQSLGLGEYVISIQEFSNRNLSLKIDSIWLKRNEVRAMLNEKVPLSKDKIKDTIKSTFNSLLNLNNGYVKGEAGTYD